MAANVVDPLAENRAQRRGWTDDEVLGLLRSNYRPAAAQLKIPAQELDSNVEALVKLLDR